VPRVVLALVRVGVALAVFALILTRIDLAGVWESLRDTSLAACFLAFGVWMVGWLIVSHRLALLMQAQDVQIGTFEALEINLATLFWGLFLPGGNITGIAVRFYRLARAGGRYAAGLLAMAGDRLTATGAVSLIGIVCWLLDRQAQRGPAIVVLVLGAMIFTATILPLVAAERVRRLARWLHGGSLGWLEAPVRRAWQGFEAIARLPPRTLGLLIFLSCLAQGPGILAYEILAHALGLSLSFVTLGWVRSVVLIVTALPISIGGLGVREGVLLILLRPYGVADHDALAFSLLIFAVTMVWTGILGGLFELLRWLAPRAPAAPRMQGDTVE
jgi:hypothetical protein